MKLLVSLLAVSTVICAAPSVEPAQSNQLTFQVGQHAVDVSAAVDAVSHVQDTVKELVSGSNEADEQEYVSPCSEID